MLKWAVRCGWTAFYSSLAVESRPVSIVSRRLRGFFAVCVLSSRDNGNDDDNDAAADDAVLICIPVTVTVTVSLYEVQCVA